MAISRLLLSALITWCMTTAIVQASGTQSGHYCEVPVAQEESKTEPCKNIWKIIPTGYVFSKVLGNVDQKDIMSNPDAECEFVRTTHKIATKCCTGWTGPKCDEPSCTPNCTNGGVCKGVSDGKTFLAPIPVCDCPAPYSGVTCQEDTSKITANKRYCYQSGSCFGNLEHPEPVLIEDCCTKDFAGSWGKQSNGLECTACVRNDEVDVKKNTDRATCMTSGEDIYRTFDDVYFHYHHPCAVGLLVSSQVDVYTFTECDADDACTCYKVVNMVIQHEESKQVEYILRNKELTVRDGTVSPARTITRDASSLDKNTVDNLDNIGSVNWKIDDDNSVHITVTTLQVSMRVDEDGTFMLTIHKDSPLYTRQDISGICGNFNGKAQGW